MSRYNYLEQLHAHDDWIILQVAAVHRVRFS